ncbi:hypothetical protein V6N13_103298 [Hibiscus sabdariffa]
MSVVSLSTSGRQATLLPPYPLLYHNTSITLSSKLWKILFLEVQNAKHLGLSLIEREENRLKERMSCLLPQFKCQPDTFSIQFRTHHSHHCAFAVALKFSGLIFVVLGAFVANRSTLRGKLRATLAAENLLTSDDAVIAAAAAEAVALARAAAKGSSATDNLTSKWGLFTEAERAGIVGDIPSDERELEEDSEQNSTEESDELEPTSEELKLLEEQLSGSIAVRSTRQTERKAKRTRAAKKGSVNMISVKSGSTNKKRRGALQEVDYSDPLRYLRGTTSTSRLLTANEEIKLSEGIQDLLKLESLQEELTERCGREPTYAQWAAAAGVDRRTLRQRLSYGTLCKDKMVKSNIRLVISIAKNYQGAGMNLQDLVQEGCRGLIRGAEKFDASKGFKFSTYAHWWIKQAVRKSLSDQSRTIRLPFHMVEATYRVKEARKQLYSENGRHPDNEEVAQATGLSMKRLTAVLLSPKAPRSLDQKIGINQNLKPSEIIADPEADSAEDILLKEFMKKDLEKVLDSLSPRERQVIRWRFGMEDGRMKTLQEIGESMGVSRERIRQIELCAFRKLKNKRRTKHLQQYLLSYAS